MTNKNSTRYFSKKQENKIAKSVGGRRTANSGATMFSKGDVVVNNWLIECKTKTKPSESITIHREWLDKNEEEAFSMGCDHSTLCFDFGDLHNSKQYYIISAEDFKTLLENTKNEEDLNERFKQI